MSNFDHYAAAAVLVRHLIQSGRTKEASVIEKAIAEGSTGSEIFMALRFSIAEIVAHTPLEGEAKIVASILLTELDKALE